MSKQWLQIVQLLQSLKTIENPENLDPNIPFTQQGIDSLDLAGIFLAVEDEFGIKLLDDPANRPKSFSDILIIIDKPRS